MMKKTVLFLALLLIVGCTTAQDKSLNLSGEWQFRLDPENKGITEKWFNTGSFTDRIQLPGSLQEQGYGNDVSVETKWTGAVNDDSWYKDAKYEKYRQKGNVKVPFWLNPDKHYVGVAWYRKEIDIPSNWNDRTIILEMERPHWGTTLYIDGVETDQSNAMSTPHRFVLSGLTTGKHTLTVRVDNNVIIPVGINAHSVSDHTQSNWNGIVGEIALVSKPQVYIEQVQIFPDIANKKVKVGVRVLGKKNAGKASLSLQIETAEGRVTGKPYTLEFDATDTQQLEAVLDAGDDIRLWSEFTPNVYRLRSTVATGKEKDEKLTSFGFREFKRNGLRFAVNGHPIFLRGTLECCIFPLTGYPSVDESYWEKIYRTCQEFGLNHVRFHSWCPPEVAFDVADRMGIYLQVECAAWATVGDGGPQDKWLYEESERIIKEYGNHPSFCLMAHGNEPHGPNQVEYLRKFIAHWKQKDDRRVYTSGAGWPYIENADYWNAPEPRIQHWGEGLGSVINSQPPSFAYDFADTLKRDMPTVSHEIGQWCVYPNFKEIDKYTGVLKAKNFEIFRETLAENNMGDLAEDFLYASGRLQTLCYKADIEAALRTPEFAGFQLLDLHDFPGQGTALVGVLDAFWDTKGYVDGKEYSTFCNETVPLVRFPKVTFLNNETLKAPVEFAHFGEKPIQDANIVWTAITSDNRFIGKGSFTKNLPLDNCIQVGNIELSFEQVKEPTRVTVTVEIENSSVKNQWNIWVYPARKPVINKQPYITAKLDNAAMERLNKGENVLLIPGQGNVLPEKGGNIAVGFSSIFWNTAWTRGQAPHTLGILCNPQHPALSTFPTEKYSDYQWWDIVSYCDAMVMDDFPAEFRPIVHLIDDWFTNRKLGILFEAKVGNGKLMVCSVDFQKDMSKRPAAAQFRQSILEYMTSDRFDPKQEIKAETVKNLFKR